uniref:Calcineurin-like phosphoesterase domain-containing protein n=1 Tax=uncultured organism MedDCM-OCT-S08-C288 TaxID=743637 RepID=D6PJ90_9ZZZZ|nr:hypothetical protein [uncultured organism MedDCM-OCT-S08-C288]
MARHPERGRKEDVKYLDFVKEGQRLADELRAQGAGLVLALTHMRLPNDERLARETRGIDIILAGHDHHYEVKEVDHTLILKSGTGAHFFMIPAPQCVFGRSLRISPRHAPRA